MFSGIIEALAPAIETKYVGSAGLGAKASRIILLVRRPSSFDDVSLGDSIAVNGVCLTVEENDSDILRFTLGPETLSVLGSALDVWSRLPLHLERSLRFSDRLHGHFVTGHVDDIGRVLAIDDKPGPVRTLRISFPSRLASYFWQKGSVALQGVSLTLNRVETTEAYFEVTLIPETLKRTHLGQVKVGDGLSLEIDSFARGLVHYLNQTSGDLRS